MHRELMGLEVGRTMGPGLGRIGPHYGFSNNGADPLLQLRLIMLGLLLQHLAKQQQPQQSGDSFARGSEGADRKAAPAEPGENDVRAGDLAMQRELAPPANDGGDRGDRGEVSNALSHGYQYLIGGDFREGASQLRNSGAQGVAILSREGATRQGVAALGDRVQPFAYNNAFQLQPDERMPAGVRTVGRDSSWGEAIPDFRSPAWQARRIGEAVDAANKGFAGVMLDNVPNAGASRDGADYVKRMVETARAHSGNQNFSAILQNGENLVRAHPWLVDRGYVSALQKEDVSFRATNGGRNTGARVSESDRAEIRRDYQALRARHPNLPLISIDYPSSRSQAMDARDRARAFGFDVAHVALQDGMLRRISTETRVL